MVLAAVTVGFANYWLFVNYSNEHNVITDPTDSSNDAVTNYLMAVSVVWGFFTYYVSSKIENKFERVQETVAAEDFDAFCIEVQKGLSMPIRLLHLFVSVSFLTGFHHYHMGNQSAIVQTQWGTAFLVTVVILFLIDLENPVHGIINVEHIPAEWLRDLKQRKAELKQNQAK